MGIDEHKTPPPVSFYFSVEFVGTLLIEDVAFLEVTGMTMELETQEIDLGGGNKRILPIRQKHGNLVCKRPLSPVGMSGLARWTDRIMKGGIDSEIVTCNLNVKLLDPDGNPQCVWNIERAYPIKWDISGFDAKKNEIVIETIEFAYDTITRMM